jgi:hypothetical protein
VIKQIGSVAGTEMQELRGSAKILVEESIRATDNGLIVDELQRGDNVLLLHKTPCHSRSQIACPEEPPVSVGTDLFGHFLELGGIVVKFTLK